MSISFSGLASGLNTSSWIESLTALKQAKIETLEEQKETVLLSRETLNNIKSFFTSFRSMLERVTDAKFGAASMDIFAQKIATSSNLNVLTAAATTEAEEASYNVLVNKLATNTEALSGINKITTIIQTETAVAGTKLTDLGVKTGNIGIHNNGAYNIISIEEKDTIADFVDKLHDIGVGASYNARTGIFGVNLDSDDIDDTLTTQKDGTVGTGIVKALNLSEKGGYKSENLQISNVDTIVNTATGATKLSALGVKAGALKMEANGAEYTFNITNNSTVDEFVNAMKGVNINASFENGVLKIIDAEITSDGGTNIISALGLETKTNQNTQVSNGLNYTEVKTAGLQDKVTEFIDAKGAVNIFDKEGNAVGSVTITDSTTFDSLFEQLADYGIKGRLEDGVISFGSTNGNYMTGTLMDKLGVGITTTTTTTYTSGAGLSSGGAVSYNTVTDSTTTTYQTTTSTTTDTETIGTGMSSGGSVNYNTVTDSTTTTYQTTTSTTTDTETIGTGMSSGGAINHTTVRDEVTTVYSTVTLTHTTTAAMNVTSSGILTYETVVTSTTTETIAVDLTSSGGVYYTTVIAGTTTPGTGGSSGGSSGGSTEESGNIYVMNSSAPVYANNKTAGSSAGVDKYITPEIIVTDPTLLTAAINNYTTIGISSAAMLAEFANFVNAGNNCKDKVIVLTEDIDLSGYSDWTPIGKYDSFSGYRSTFSGTFDGQGHVIKNLNIKTTTANEQGLFGSVRNGTIKNLGIENANIDITTDSYQAVRLGVLMGSGENVNISNCYSTGMIKRKMSTTDQSSGTEIGGLVGTIAGASAIADSYSDVNFEVNSNIHMYIGGLVGLGSSLTLTNCHSTGYINATINNDQYSGDDSAGGLVGYSNYITIRSCYTTGQITFNSKRQAYSGGLVGYTRYGYTENSYTTGNITLNTSNTSSTVSAGGTFGFIDSGTIKNCYTTGDITASGNYSCAGGLVGYNDTYANLTLDTNFVTGKISAKWIKGGLAGYNSNSGNSYKNCYYDSDKNSSSGVSGGGVVGVSGSKLSQASYLQTIGFTEAAGWEYNGSSAKPTLKSEKQMNAGTTLKELLGDGCASQTIVVQTSSGMKNIVISENDSIGKVLSEAGLEVSVTDGKMTLSGEKNGISIVSVSPSLNNALHLVGETTGNNSGTSSGGIKAVALSSTSPIKYMRKNVDSDYNESYTEDTLAWNAYSVTRNLGTDSYLTLSWLGCDETNYITVQNGATTTVLTLDNSDEYIFRKLDSNYSDEDRARTLYGMLKKVGIKMSITNGVVSFEGDSSHYILGMSAQLRIALNLQSDKGYTVESSNTDSGSSSGSSSGSGPITNTIYASSSSSNQALSKFGVNTVNYITVKNGSTTSIVTISGDTTIAQLSAELAGVGISTDVTNGKFTFSGDDSHYIMGMTTNIKSALNLTASGGKGYTVQTTQTTSNKTVTLASANTDIQLSALGAIGNNFITVQSGDTTRTINVDSSMTLGDLTSALAVSGIAVTAAGGKLTFSGDDSHAVIGVTQNLADALKITTGNNKSYTVKTSSTTSTTTSQTTIHTTTSVQMTGDTTFAQLGMTSNTETIVGVRNGIGFTMTVTSTDTVGDIVQELEDFGFNASVRGGKFYVDGSENTYITGLSTNLKKALGITANPGNGTSYRVVTHTTTTTTTTPIENTIHTTTSVQMTGDTTFAQLGMTSNTETIVGVRNGIGFTMTVTSTDTVGDIVQELEDFGFNASVRGGKFYVDGSEDTYITGLSTNLKKALGITANPGNGTSYRVVTHTTTTTTTTPIENTIHTTTSIQMSEETRFAQLGMNSDQTINGVRNGKAFSITVTSADTVGDIINALAEYDINASVRGGKIYINGSEDAYITSMSNGIKSALGITTNPGNGNSYTTTTIKTYANTSATKGTLKQITITTAMTRDTELAELGITSGEFNIWNNGVKYTALISSDETVGSFMDTLAKFGIQAAIINNGSSSTLQITGNGDAYIAKSASTTNASNVVDVLFPSANNNTTYNYTGILQSFSTVTTNSTATEDTLLSAFDTPWGGTTLKAEGKLALSVDGKNRIIQITETDTFGSLIDKLDKIGVEASLIGGNFYLSGMNNVSIIAAQTTSSIINPNASIKLEFKNHIDNFLESTAAIEKTTTIVEESTLSAANYADLNTKLSTLNISDGTFSIYRNGQKATINIDSENTFDDLRSLISAKFADVDLKFENGKLVIYSKTDGVEVKAGATTDSSNLLSITGLTMDEEGHSVSARQLFKVNENSLVTQAGLFREGNITAGDFTVGEQVINIDNNSTLSDIITQINSSEKANATAYWDSINGRLVIKSRTTGAALINIEAGKSNFTDILGFTDTQRYADGSIKTSRMITETQNLGDNANVSINGTQITSTSNTLTSDITRIKGLTINLNGLTNGSAVTLKVEKDKESVANALNDIVESYNELMKNVDEAIARDGALHNQTTLKMIRNQIRSMMTSSINGDNAFKNLDSIGISVSAASKSNISTSNESIINLAFDKEKFLKAFNADDKAVKELLIGKGLLNAPGSTEGVFTKVENIVENALASVVGYFSITDDSYAREIKRIDNKIVKGNTAIEKYRAQLNKKFNSMDLLIGNMQNQYASFLN